MSNTRSSAIDFSARIPTWEVGLGGMLLGQVLGDLVILSSVGPRS